MVDIVSVCALAVLLIVCIVIALFSRDKGTKMSAICVAFVCIALLLAYMEILSKEY